MTGITQQKDNHCRKYHLLFKMFIHVTDGKYVKDYVLDLFFNTGERKRVDLKDELYGEIFEPLKNKNFFKDFFISQNTIEWKNGADFAPEFLHKIGE